MIAVINRETREIQTWSKRNIKSFCKPEDVAKMRKDKNHKGLYFVIEFIGLDYALGMWEVDKYDLIVLSAM